MMTKHNRLVLRCLEKSVAAKDYNRIKLALLRLGEPLRVELPTLGNALMILTHDEWLCIDGSSEERPLLAWTAFADTGRNSLVEPVPCTLELYHTHAGILMGKILPVLETVLNQHLASQSEQKRTNDETRE